MNYAWLAMVVCKYTNVAAALRCVRRMRALVRKGAKFSTIDRTIWYALAIFNLSVFNADHNPVPMPVPRARQPPNSARGEVVGRHGARGDVQCARDRRGLRSTCCSMSGCRERCQVGPNDASWSMHSCGNTAIKGLSWPNFWANLASFSLGSRRPKIRTGRGPDRWRGCHYCSSAARAARGGGSRSGRRRPRAGQPCFEIAGSRPRDTRSGSRRRDTTPPH